MREWEWEWEWCAEDVMNSLLLLLLLPLLLRHEQRGREKESVLEQRMGGGTVGERGWW